MATVPKVNLYVSHRKTIGKLVGKDHMVHVIESIIGRKCDDVIVRIDTSEGEKWVSVTVIYDSVSSELQAFIDKVGERKRCVVMGSITDKSDWSWYVDVENMFEPSWIPINYEAPTTIFKDN